MSVGTCTLLLPFPPPPPPPRPYPLWNLRGGGGVRLKKRDRVNTKFCYFRIYIKIFAKIHLKIIYMFAKMINIRENIKLRLFLLNCKKAFSFQCQE
jgi:hypothetical protein